MDSRTHNRTIAAADPHAGASAPPRMPPHFNRTVVENLVRDIEADNNEVVLRIGYFGRRLAHSFPAAQGVTVVRDAADRASFGSRRWFLLTGLLGFAALHAGGDDPGEGLDAYGKLFDSAERALSASAADICHRAVYDYNGFVLRTFQRTPAPALAGRIGALETEEVLCKGIQGTFRLLARGHAGRYAPPWSAALAALDASPVAMALTEEGLQEVDRVSAAVPPAVRLAAMIHAAGIFLAFDPARSLDALAAAERLGGKVPPEAMVRCQSLIVAASLQTYAVDRAVVAQEEVVRLTGRGRPLLAVLYLRANDLSRYGNVYQAIRRDGAAGESMQFAYALHRFVEDSASPPALRARADDDAFQILDGYVRMPPPHAAASDLLSARLALAHCWVRRHNLEKAVAVLRASGSAPADTPPARALQKAALAEAQRWQTVLQRSMVAANGRRDPDRST